MRQADHKKYNHQGLLLDAILNEPLPAPRLKLPKQIAVEELPAWSMTKSPEPKNKRTVAKIPTRQLSGGYDGREYDDG